MRAEVCLWSEENALALQSAKELMTLERFRESARGLIMRAHAALGKSAEAWRADEHCRARIARELGVDPSPQAKATSGRLLHSLEHSHHETP